MHLRVQRLDPAVHHLGKAGHLGDIPHRRAPPRAGSWRCPPVESSSTPRAASAVPARQAGLVGNGKKRAAHGGRSVIGVGSLGSGQFRTVSGHGSSSLVPLKVADRRRASPAPWPGTSGCASHTPSRGRIKRSVWSHAAAAAPFFEVDAEASTAISARRRAEHPDFAARSAIDTARRPCRARVDLRVQVKADLEGHAGEPGVHRPVERRFFDGRLQREQHNPRRAATAPVAATARAAHMGQPVHGDIAVMPALEPQPVGQVAHLTGTCRGRILQHLARPADPAAAPSRARNSPRRHSVECDGVARPAAAIPRQRSPPEPQLTIIGRRPRSVRTPASRHGPAPRPARGRRRGIHDDRGPPAESRESPSPARRPGAALDARGRQRLVQPPSRPRPPPWKRASPPSAWRSLRRWARCARSPRMAGVRGPASCSACAPRSAG